ncbi:MAG: glycosyltransferase, partial [Xanthomonadales bacterium]|nr:glycosyltransferase [Xanthomonadales bacterium]
TFVDHFESLRVLADPVNRGKGHAVRTGMLAADGDIRLFADADGSTPWDEYHSLRPALDAADIAIAS